MVTVNIKTIGIIFLSVFSMNLTADKKQVKKTADIVIFSYNRPLQLFALLESIRKYVHNIHQIHVLYRVGNTAYDLAYKELKAIFPKINFVKQGNKPKEDFKPLLLGCFFATSAEYILFAVDDDIVKAPVDLKQCCEVMKQTNSYCFFLRLGKNITKQYGQSNVSLTIPPCKKVKDSIFQYYVDQGCYGDWRYPHNLDMTLYKKKDIASFFVKTAYYSPNTLESYWAHEAHFNIYALFYETSRMFSVPLNCVQQDWQNGCIGTYSAQDLLQLWQAGYAFDLTKIIPAHRDCVFVDCLPDQIFRARFKS